MLAGSELERVYIFYFDNISINRFNNTYTYEYTFGKQAREIIVFIAFRQCICIIYISITYRSIDLVYITTHLLANKQNIVWCLGHLGSAYVSFSFR